MDEILPVVITLLVMLVGVSGVILPVLPDVWLIWLAALGYGLIAGFDGWIGGVSMVLMTLLAVAGVSVDLVLAHAYTARGGASWQAIAASILLGLVGLWFFPPIGPLVGAVLGLFLVEFFQRGRKAREAWQAVRDYLLGCGWSVVLRLALAFAMIAIYLAWVLLARV
jgi:uncharacterized protein